jgi:hypothetical protein
MSDNNTPDLDVLQSIRMILVPGIIYKWSEHRLGGTLDFWAVITIPADKLAKKQREENESDGNRFQRLRLPQEQCHVRADRRNVSYQITPAIRQ